MPIRLALEGEWNDEYNELVELMDMQRNILITCTVLILVFAGLQVVEGQKYERKYNTIGHRILDIESVAGNVKRKHYKRLDKIIDKVIGNTNYDSSLTKIGEKRQQAVQVLETIGKELSDFGFRVKIPTFDLSDALTTKKVGSDKFFNFDCDTSSFIYLAIAEKLEIPLYFIEVKNFGEALNHNFVRWDLGGGVWIDLSLIHI